MKTKNIVLKTILLLAIALAAHTTALSQEQENDSSFYQRLKYKPNFQLHNRRSLIDKKLVAFWGGKLGLKLNKYHEIGISYSYLPFKHTYSAQIADSNFSAAARLNLIALYYEPTLLFRNKWEVDVPLFIGTGKVKSSYNNFTSDDYSFSRTTKVYMAEASIIAYYKFYKYFSFGMGAGYRKTFGPDKIINENFTAPFFQAKIRLEFEAVGKDLRKYLRKQKAKKTTF